MKAVLTALALLLFIPLNAQFIDTFDFGAAKVGTGYSVSTNSVISLAASSGFGSGACGVGFGLSGGAKGVGLGSGSWATAVGNVSGSSSSKTSDISPSSGRKTDLGGSIASFVLLHSGVIIHYASHDNIDLKIRDNVQAWRGSAPQCRIDDYIRYLPLAADLGLEFLGAKANNNFVDRSVELGVAFASVMILTRGSKLVIASQRPNGGDFKSFPSGHSSMAFMGAELVRMEYGPAYGAAAYTVATLVGCLRIYNNRHWFSDVLAGAGVGIFSAHVGRWLMEPTKNLFKISFPDSDIQTGKSTLNAQIVPSVDPISGTLCAGLALNF